MTEAVPPHARPGVPHQWATRAAFFIAGFSMSTWAPLIPYAKGRLGLSDGHLGALLLCLGAGSVVGMPLAGGLAGRFGCRAVIVVSALLLCVALPVMAGAGHVALLAGALVLFGAAIGTMDVTMNIQAVIVERESGRAMMSGFHGLYSAGGIAGAGVVSGLLALHLSPVGATGVVVALTLLTLAVSLPGLLPYGGGSGGPPFAIPRGRVLLLGSFCFVLFLAEGSVLDWGAVLLTTLRHVDASHAGLGYVAFSVAMTTCRLTGDAIVRVVGPGRVVLLGTLCAAAGFLLAAFVPSPVVGVIGFALVGVGCSNAVPVMFSAAGRQTLMPTNLAIAAVTTLGYAGILLGPAMIGFVANYLGLGIGLSLVALLLVGVSVVSRRAGLNGAAEQGH